MYFWGKHENASQTEHENLNKCIIYLLTTPAPFSFLLSSSGQTEATAAPAAATQTHWTLIHSSSGSVCIFIIAAAENVCFCSLMNSSAPERVNESFTGTSQLTGHLAQAVNDCWSAFFRVNWQHDENLQKDKTNRMFWSGGSQIILFFPAKTDFLCIVVSFFAEQPIRKQLLQLPQFEVVFLFPLTEEEDDLEPLQQLLQARLAAHLGRFGQVLFSEDRII